MKRLIIWTLSAALLMIGGPFLVLTAFSGMDAMGACFILFFAVNPLFSAVCGVFSGMRIRRLWPLPAITAVLFLAGAWLFFEPGETAFLIYALGYLLIGAVAMFIAALAVYFRKH